MSLQSYTASYHPDIHTTALLVVHVKEDVLLTQRKDAFSVELIWLNLLLSFLISVLVTAVLPALHFCECYDPERFLFPAVV